jgi:hypothetical protein
VIEVEKGFRVKQRRYGRRGRRLLGLICSGKAGMEEGIGRLMS